MFAMMEISPWGESLRNRDIGSAVRGKETRGEKSDVYRKIRGGEVPTDRLSRPGGTNDEK